jgi:hypothetical protein
MSDSNYDVGQVLWVIRSDRPGMIALQIQEVITKRTMNGEDIQYLAYTPGVEEQFLLHTIKGRIFTDLESAREALYKQATEAIDSVIEKVRSQANQAFGQKKDELQQDPLSFIQNIQAPKSITTPKKDLEPEDGFEIVEMDGKKVKIKLPEGI